MTYKLNYIMGNRAEQVVLFNKDVAASTALSLKDRGALDIQISCNGANEVESMREAVETMGLADQLELIERFRSYIKLIS